MRGRTTPDARRSPARCIIVLAAVLALYVIYLLRKPIGWLVIAAFLAVAMSGPVNLLQRGTCARGLAIALAYLVAVHAPHRAGGDPRAADRAGRQRPRRQRARVRQRRPGLRQQERDAAQAQRRLRHHRQAQGAGGQAAEQGSAARPGRSRDLGVGAGQLDLRRGDDPHPVDLHGGRRERVGARRSWRSSRRTREARLRRALDRSANAVGTYVAGAAVTGDDRRRHDVHRPEDPRRAVRGAAGGGRRSSST